MGPIPTEVFLTSGVGVHHHRLAAFEAALRAARIERQNLVAVSSIVPPGCRLVPRDEGLARLRPGEITYGVIARCDSDESGRRITAAIGVARPAEPGRYGYISEHFGYGMTARECGDRAEDLAATMLASTMGFDLDPEAAWDERRQLYAHSGTSIEALSCTAAAEGAPGGRWTCAVAAAVFLL
ncbi:pyruvoyl-dependent arginine decarboxylase [Azospirillum sp. ST 5-10]|uniref:pyruvoyl-dependent arginine decarboxylase n=1 Tax=unclassified Azospirillum TaxID=2630922 RepID=UPI003F4A3DEE